MDAAQEVKSRLDVADIVGEYLTLKPAGSGAFKALCPFHGEKTPSFSISRARQSWHCFGCDQGGDVISFVMKMEGMEFREALELLAQKAGVTLPSYDPTQSSRRKRLQEVNDLASRFFRSTLSTAPQAEIARAYLKKRGVDDLTSDLFRFGYALESWSALSDALKEKGVTEEELVAAGLAIKRDPGSGIRATGVYDRFRGRLMFPIADVHGNIVGFTGRILGDSKEAKYVNTPETAVYKKSGVLYGLDKARGEIRRLDQAIIVEGNMDVVTCHQFGMTNVVAASGTALTSDQLSLLKRFTSNLAIAFDQDAAGNAATLRGLDLARAQDFSIKIITLPPEAGKDPDEAIRKNIETWKQAVREAPGIMEWVYRNAFRTSADGRPQTAEVKKQIARGVLPEIKRIADPVERDAWLQRLSKDLAVSVDALKEALGMAVQKRQWTEASAPPFAKGWISESQRESAEKPPVESRARAMEKRVLSALIARPELFSWAAGKAELRADEFSELDLGSLYGRLQMLYSVDHSQQPAPDIRSGQPLRPPAGLTADETQLFDALAYEAEREYQEATSEMVTRDLTSGIQTLRHGRTARECLELEEEMREAERAGDAARIAALTARFQSLM